MFLQVKKAHALLSIADMLLKVGELRRTMPDSESTLAPLGASDAPVLTENIPGKRSTLLFTPGVTRASAATAVSQHTPVTGCAFLERQKNRKLSLLQLRVGCMKGKGQQHFRVLLK